LAAAHIFFFASRRGHTRLVSDWSSDVCSSDLAPCAPEPGPAPDAIARFAFAPEIVGVRIAPASKLVPAGIAREPAMASTGLLARSEEGRVGEGGEWTGGVWEVEERA